MSPIELLSKADVSVRPEPSVVWSAKDARLTPRVSLTNAQREQIADYAYRYGLAPESYDILVADGDLLFTPCGTGVVSVLTDGKYWHIPGGILAPEELKPRIIRWLKEISEVQGLTLLLYSILPEEVGLFREAGYEINMLGVEPIIELGNVDWSGSQHRWVRRQTSFCKRASLETVEISDEGGRRAMASELLDILTEDLSGRTFPKPLRLLEGAFDPGRLHQRRLFVARDKANGSIHGFLACSPMENGDAWAFETYRKRDSAPRGTIPFLFREVIDLLQSEGVRRVSLCLVPGKSVLEQPNLEGHRMVRRILDVWYHRMNALFNIKGQDYFKQRFRPVDEPRYTCVSTHSSIWTLVSFLKTTGAMKPSPLNLMRNLWRSLRRK